MQVSMSVKLPTAQGKRAKEAARKAVVSQRLAQREQEKAKKAKIEDTKKTIDAVKVNTKSAILKLDAQIKKINEENKEIVLRLRQLEDRKKIVLDKFNARLAHLQQQLRKLLGKKPIIKR